MEIQFHENPDSNVLIPWINGVTLHKDLAEYLVTRFYYPGNIRENLRPVGQGTLRNIAYDLKMLLEHLAFNGVHYCDADYDDHIFALLEKLNKDNTPEVFNKKFTRIRDFYDF